MIYLDNITSGQTVYIPRNESGVNPHKSNSYWEGFEDGYESGETHQKNLLSSVTFTENGEYERENGWSAVTVDVPQTGSTARLEEKTVVISADTTNVTPSSGYDGMSAVTVDASSYAQQNYDDGFDDGFTDGYASGSTDEKAKLSAVTFTTNTAVTISDGGYSAITVNVPQTGSSLNVEANKPYTATTNGNYTITPTSASTTLVMDYDDGDDFYFTASTYPSVGRFEIGTIIFWNGDGDRIGSVDIYYDNGQIDYDDSDWGYRIYTGTTGNTMLYVGFYEDDYENCTWIKDDDYNLQYDAMSAVSLNVNVDTASTYNSGYTSGYTDGQDNIISTFSAMTATTNGQYGSSAHPLSAITIEVPQTGSSIPLSSITFTANTSVTVTDKAFTAITVNVPQSGGSGVNYIEYIGINNPNKNTCYFELGNTGTGLDSKIVIEHSTLSIENTDFNWENWLMFSDTERGRIFVSSTYNKIMFDGRYNNSSISVSSVTDETIILENTGVTIGGVSYNAAYNTSQVSDCNNMTVFCAYGNYFSTPSSQLKYGRIGKISIYDSANTLTYQYKPCLDENNIICFHEVVNDVYVYPNNGGDTYLYSGPIINDMYESGYTDGQNSIINTFSAMTATTNGQYGSSAHPLSSITVNVPQTGGSSTLGIGSFSGNGTYSASTDNLDGYSAITVNVPTSANITDTIVYVTANTQAVSASHHNVDGFGNVLIRAEYWWQSGYTSGFTDGTGALSAITFTANTAVTLNQGGYSAVTVNIDTATTWNDGYAAGQGELFCLYCENALFNIGESSSEAEFDDVYINLLTLSGFNITVGGGGRGGQLVATDSGSTVGFVGYWQTSGNTYTTPVTSIAKGTIPTGMVSVGITDYGHINFYVDGTSATSSGGAKIPTGSYNLSFSGDSFYLGSIRRNSYYNCFTPYVDDNGNACMIGPNRTLVYPTSGTCYAVYKKVTKNGEYVYYMNKEVGRVTQ